MTNEELMKQIAIDIHNAGGTAYLVGGYVRDYLLGAPSTDYDIEVHGIEQESLEAILKSYGEVDLIGKPFGIYTFKEYDLDIALPRRELRTGDGHKDFQVEVDPFMGTLEACSRRDFTINAMMVNILSGEIIDPFGGKKDLKKKRIRLVNSRTFEEDPLRVLRCAQFASRFAFEIDRETIHLCKRMDISTLSKERITHEMEKALLQAEYPSLFFISLRKMNQLNPWFKEVFDLIDVPQSKLHHPEGDVWNHTMNVLNAGKKLLPYIQEENHLFFLLACLCHDLGKAVSTKVHEKGVVHSYGHELTGVTLAEDLLNRLYGRKEMNAYVTSLVKYHMKPHAWLADGSSIKASNKVFDDVVNQNDLIYIAMADQMGAGNFKIEQRIRLLKARLNTYHEMMSIPYVTSYELMEVGINGKDLGLALKKAHQLKLAGVSKESAFAQIKSEFLNKKKE